MWTILIILRKSGYKYELNVSCQKQCLSNKIRHLPQFNMKFNHMGNLLFKISWFSFDLYTGHTVYHNTTFVYEFIYE